jgi:glycosyltransferase involved in cell wall biosynthesis
MRCPGGIDPRLIREGTNGYFVDGARSESIAWTALSLLQSPDRLAANAVSSQQMASAYDWEMVATRYEEVYAREISYRRFTSS